MKEPKEKYELLISKAKAAKRKWEPFKYEEHHILPRCLGGTDSKENLVLLTIREHFKAHVLLSEAYPDNEKLAAACIRMIRGWQGQHLKVSEEQFEVLRVKAARFISKVHKGRIKSEAERENIRKARLAAKPRKFSEEARANMAAARRKTWEERRANGSHLEIAAKVKETRERNGSYIFSDEWRKNIGEASKGRIPWNKGKRGELSEETRAKMRESATNRKKHTV